MDIESGIASAVTAASFIHAQYLHHRSAVTDQRLHEEEINLVKDQHRENYDQQRMVYLQQGTTDMQLHLHQMNAGIKLYR